MKSIINYPVKVFTTGFIVLVFLSLLLFQIRKSCESSLSVRKPDDMAIRREPSGLVPDEFENDPNVVEHSRVSAHARIRAPLSFGIFDYFQARVPGGRHSNVYFYESDTDCMYFDKKSGLIVYYYLDTQVMPDKRTTKKRARCYVGPEGISETQEKILGRFNELIIDYSWIDRQHESRGLIVYDKKYRRFFKIDFNKRTIIKGPELIEDYRYRKPIRIGRSIKNWSLLGIGWSPPIIKNYDERQNIRDMRSALKPIIPVDRDLEAVKYLTVIDKSGRIDLLDIESLEFTENFGIGWLYDPEIYIGSRRNYTRPINLLDYDVLPLVLTTHYFENPERSGSTFGDPYYNIVRKPVRVERKYLGMFVASLSRSGTGLALTAYDEKGREVIKREAVVQKEGPRTVSHRSSRVVYFRPSWISAFTVGKYLVETIHPPILSLGSFYTAYSIDAAAGHRGLFLLPNSFIAMQGRTDLGNFVERFFSALWWLMPSIIFSIWLSTKITKDAVIVGLSKNVRLYWVIGTIAFGLTAYITYRLTRPKMVLVTCQNCGNPRRPDMSKCHRCGSKWHVPELTPPAWRVLG